MPPSCEPVPDPLQQENECKVQEGEMIPGTQDKIPALPDSSLPCLDTIIFSLPSYVSTATVQDGRTYQVDGAEAFIKLSTEASRGYKR